MTEEEEFNRDQSALFTGWDSEDIEFRFEKEDFECWLNRTESRRGKRRLAQTVFSMLKNASSAFIGMGGYLSINNLREYKRELQDNDKSPATINNRIIAVGTYSKFLAEKYNNKHLISLRVNLIPTQPRQYIDNVITRADYDFMVTEANKNTRNPNVYLGLRVMGTTGVRLSELLQVKVEDVRLGYIDVLGKGAKRRRIYFPKRAREEILDYLKGIEGGESGYLIRYWRSKKGRQTGAYEQNTRENGDIKNFMTFKRGFQKTIMDFGIKLGIDESVLHPHGFRHFFAKEFLRHRLDISLLADLLGHSSLDITRIYLKMTSREQADVIDEVVQW